MFTCTRGDIAEVGTEEGKLHLFVAIDRTSKLAVAQLVEKANRKTAWEFLEHLLYTVAAPAARSSKARMPDLPRSNPTHMNPPCSGEGFAT